MIVVFNHKSQILFNYCKKIYGYVVRDSAFLILNINKKIYLRKSGINFQKVLYFGWSLDFAIIIQYFLVGLPLTVHFYKIFRF